MDKKKIAERLVELRGRRTQKEIAEKLGISIASIAMYENGKRMPRDEVKLAIAELYGESIQYIFFDGK